MFTLEMIEEIMSSFEVTKDIINNNTTLENNVVVLDLPNCIWWAKYDETKEEEERWELCVKLVGAPNSTGVTLADALQNNLLFDYIVAH